MSFTVTVVSCVVLTVTLLQHSYPSAAASVSVADNRQNADVPGSNVYGMDWNNENLQSMRRQFSQPKNIRNNQPLRKPNERRNNFGQLPLQGVGVAVASILNNKRRRTAAILKSTANVLTNVATNLRGDDVLSSSRDILATSNRFNPFPIVVLGSSATQYPNQQRPKPLSAVQQGSYPLGIQNPGKQEFVPQFPPPLPTRPKFPPPQPTQNQFPIVSIQSGSQSSSASNVATPNQSDLLAIPVASGGSVPPKNYNPVDQMIILNNVPWLDRQGNNQQSSNNLPLPQNNNNFGQHGQSNAFGPSLSSYPNSVYSVVDGIQEFTLDLISTFRAMGINDNVVFSPISIASLLSLLTLAAKGETKHEIEVALNLPSLQSANSQHQQYADILRRLNHASTGISIKSSSRLFVEERLPIYGSFTDKAALHYNCTVSLENFRQRPIRTKNRVNRWVKEETQGKIENFISDPFSPDTLFVAVNTIYFKGDWKTPFPEYFTGPRDFDTGKQVKRIPMMTNVFETDHYFSERLNIDIVSLPYVGDEFAMFVILPRESPKDRSIVSIESQLDTFTIEDLIHNMTNKDVSISMPKMRLSMKTSLTHSLAQLKIERMFSPALADLSGLTNSKPLWVGEVLHEAVMEVNEIGTEAAAASAASLDRFGGFQRVNINKPCIIFIRDLVNKVPLFWARLVNPDSLE